MSKYASILVPVWAVLFQPTLCLGGIMPHLCTSDEAQECNHDCECADDPCDSIGMRGPEKRTIDSSDHCLVDFSVSQDLIADESESIGSFLDTSQFPESPSFHSAIPLLI